MADQDHRRFPRLFLAHRDEDYQKISGALLLWPKGGKSQILDMSYSGIAISSQGLLDIVKMGEYIQGHILLPTQDQVRLPVSMRVVRKTAQMIGFKIDSTSLEGRLKIDQFIKDMIVGQNIRKLSPQLLHASLKSDVWFHGPFDTNFFLWFDESRKINKALIEYDNSVIQFEDGKVKVSRSSGAAEEAQGYAAPFLTKEILDQKLALGKGWMDRLKRLLTQIPGEEKEIKVLFDFLSSLKVEG